MAARKDHRIPDIQSALGAGAKPAVGEKALADEKARREHDDPRAVGGGVGKAGRKVQPENYGETKARGTPRLNQHANEFRRGSFWRGRNPPGHE